MLIITGASRIIRRLSSVAMANFVVKTDIFNGLTIVSNDQHHSLYSDSFVDTLMRSLKQWTTDGIRGVWFQVDIKQSTWIPTLVDHGFVFHHAQVDYVMMKRWLSTTEPDQMPLYPFTSIGVGGLVVNSCGEVLLMREKRGIYHGWKFPGGLADPGENLFTTAEREVYEETGVKCRAISVLCFRHQHQFKWRSNADIYFICVMQPIDEEMMTTIPCPLETAETKWMSRMEISQLPTTMFHRFHIGILERYDKMKVKMDGGSRGCYPVDYDMTELKRNWTMYYID